MGELVEQSKGKVVDKVVGAKKEELQKLIEKHLNWVVHVWAFMCHAYAYRPLKERGIRRNSSTSPACHTPLYQWYDVCLANLLETKKKNIVDV